MGKKLKKGKVGLSTQFISRARAIKKLDIPIRDFRKMCISKGVFPRIPPKSLKATHKTFYSIKDIKFLS